MHRTTPRFWRHFEQLPEPVQRIARRNFRLLIANPRHPDVDFGKLTDSRANKDSSYRNQSTVGAGLVPAQNMDRPKTEPLNIFS